MDFSLNEDQEALRDLVRKVMTEQATDEYLRELDEESRYPYELYETWVQTGLLTLPFPEEVGGLGGSVVDFVLVAEEIGRRGYDLTGVYGVPVFNGLNILHHGTSEQQQRFLPALLRGELRLSIAMTEPDAGSDAGAMRTTAVRDGDSFVINGEKVFASGAAVDHTVISVYCRTDPTARNSAALSCLLVDNDSPGLEIRPMHTLGRHMFPTTQLFFDDVRVPADRLLGPLHGGFGVMVSGLQLERIVTSAAYVGNAQTVVDEALAYATQRRQFGTRIGDFQVIAHMLVDMQTKVDAARLLTYRAAWMLDQGKDALTEISMAKLFGSEAFLEVANDGMQILGGYGYTMEYAMQRHLRAARGSTITAGTSQMQRETIARRMGLVTRPRR
ncbi:MAG: acyl-CoA/acyl-ACP dehydrogenase [Actinobacteria bacterium]|nr:acyl-CoA/acyl-ACP dehydrogenase [Actinomycetota bacterium]